MDYQETANEIVKASNLPISVIFLGVGDAHFTSFEKLDAANEPMWSTDTDKMHDRDCVTFIRYNDYRDSQS